MVYGCVLELRLAHTVLGSWQVGGFVCAQVTQNCEKLHQINP